MATPELLQPKQENGTFHSNWTAVAATSDDGKVRRHPRWTREETLVLIKGKDLVENGDRKSHRFCSAFGSDHAEPKWDMISSYCRQHGVNRGSVQCRKRWSNLTGGFRKIRAWESRLKGDQEESFWGLMSDFRKERKLPATFDRHVYDVLDGKAMAVEPVSLALVAVRDDGNNVYEDMDEDEGEGEDGEAAFENGEEHSKPEDDLSSDLQEPGIQEANRGSEKERVVDGTHTDNMSTPLPNSGVSKETRPDSPGKSSMKWKKQKLSPGVCEKDDMKKEIFKVLDANSKMIKEQLEIHNNNWTLDREQRKEDSKSLAAALNKLAEAIGKIADKL
ncbi:Trihelix transcription factor ASR3-like protein [Drosera capensis]